MTDLKHAVPATITGHSSTNDTCFRQYWQASLVVLGGNVFAGHVCNSGTEASFSSVLSS